MDIRYSTNPKDFKTYTTEDIRREFLIETLFRPDEVIATYSHVDRMVAVGCMPVHEVVPIDKGIDCWGNFGTHYFWVCQEFCVNRFNKQHRIAA
jgi:4-deoxy-L-threo-5-hexosulose-uronate ketol-isomerase